MVRTKEGRKALDGLFGDLEAEYEQLISISPAYRADEIEIPDSAGFKSSPPKNPGGHTREPATKGFWGGERGPARSASGPPWGITVGALRGLDVPRISWNLASAPELLVE
jgi:hypothetical protein